MTGTEPPQQPYVPPGAAEVYAALDRHKQQIVCAPDVYEQVRAAVRNAGLDGLYRVVENCWLNEGHALMVASEAEIMDVPFPTPQF